MLWVWLTSIFLVLILLFVLYVWLEIKGSSTSDLNYKQKIGGEYNDWTEVLEHFWGEHIHHGYSGKDGKQKKEFKQSQVEMIDQLLLWGKADSGTIETALDVGCGIGGSSRHIARKFKCSVTGITLSSVQVQRATEKSIEEGLGHLVNFQVADALHMPFQDNSFDLVWALESGEHMPDKTAFILECIRVLKPNGRLIIATWCHRDTHQSQLTLTEQNLLKKIYDAWAIPFFISIHDYRLILERFSSYLRETATDDWTDAVRNFWMDAIKQGLSFQGVFWLLRRGPKIFIRTLRDTYGCLLMHKGYHGGIVRYGLVRAIKK